MADGLLFDTKEQMIEYCGKNLAPGFKKKISWLPEELFKGVRFADLSGNAPETVLHFLLSEYLLADAPGRSSAADSIASYLNTPDLQSMAREIFRCWLDGGSSAKRRMIILPCAIYASDAVLLEINKTAEAMAKLKRGEIAEFIIKAIGMNGGNTALMILDGIANSEEQRKPRMSFARMEKAASDGFKAAAERLGVTESVLSDRVVPNLGFDKLGVRTADYGTRKFTVRLLPDFSVEITDEKGKTSKSLPKPNAGDDAAKAEAEKAALDGLKKQIKAVYSAQCKRLERVLRTGRRWPEESWKALFLDNPVMRPFAVGLIWGAYEGGKLTGSFRYLEDGTLNTACEEEYILPEGAEISIVHPAELDKDCLAAWKTQLEDYEIAQPFGQLAVTASLEDSEMDGIEITRWKGKLMSSSRRMALAVRYGAELSEDSITIFEPEIGYGIIMYTETVYWGYLGPVELYNAVFCDADLQPCGPDKLPPRFVSSMAALIDKQVM